VQVIVNARAQEGAFHSLDDFCRRVDLRVVNRRVLESLVQAGALDAFGRRSQLIAVVERMLAISAHAHQAADLGQLSLFSGLGTSAWRTDTFGILPDEPEFPNREKLETEKELLGAYFSAHPLQRIADTLRQHATHTAADLSEHLHNQGVTLGGLVKQTRVITTKKGEPMAFATMEDPFGTIELVVFPKTYNKVKDQLQADALVLVKGKVQVRDNKLNILVDHVQEYPDVVADEQLPDEVMPREAQVEMFTPTAELADDVIARAQKPAPRVTLDDWVPPPDDEPPPLPEFHDAKPAPARVEPEPAQLTEPRAEVVASAPDADSSRAPDSQDRASTLPDASVSTSSPAPNIIPPTIGRGISIPSKIVDAKIAPQADDRPQTTDGQRSAATHTLAETRAVLHTRAHRVHIHLARLEDHEEEMRRLRALYRLLVSAPGPDRFWFYIPNREGLVQLEFPNNTTTLPAIQDALNALITGWGEWQAE
jgi:DNA polymerase-3 subunit alpha